MRNITLTFIIISLALYGCKNQTPVHAEGHEHETAEEHAAHSHEGEEHGSEVHATSEKQHSDEIIFTKAQAEKTDFKVETVQPGNFHGIIKTTGQILPAPGDESVIVASSNGIVSYNRTLTEGSLVKKGQVLFNISSRNIAEGDHYSKVKAGYEKALAEYKRAENLIKDRIISQREFENIRLNYENARIAFEAVSGNRTPKGVGIPSPIEGYLKNLLIQEGEYITVGQPLATVSQNKKLVLRAEVSEKHYNALKSVRTAHFKTPYDNQVYVLSELDGKLLSFGKASDASSFYVPVSFEFDNKGNVIPGSFVEVYLVTDPIENALSIPVSALTNEMGTFYVYVQLDEEGYRKQEVNLGMNDGRKVEIRKGLQAGDKVVTRGAYQVKMASFSGAIPHGHSHEH